jgi:Ion channel
MGGTGLPRPVRSRLHRVLLRPGSGAGVNVVAHSATRGNLSSGLARAGCRCRDLHLGGLLAERSPVRKRHCWYAPIRPVVIGAFNPSHWQSLVPLVWKGTTIGYGDETPKSDLGKVLVALYAILVVNVMAVLLQPSKDFLETLCRPPAIPAAGAKADKKD